MIRFIYLISVLLVLSVVNLIGNNSTFEAELAKLPPSIINSNIIEEYIDVLGKYGKYNPEYALQISGKIINVAKHLNYSRGVNSALFAKGKFELLLNMQDEALMSFMNSLKGARLNKNNKLITELLSDIAQLYYRKADFVIALEYLQEALKIAKENSYWTNISSILNNIAVIYFEYGDYRKALTYFRESQLVAKSVKDLFGEANSCIGIGNVYNEMKDYPQAVVSYKNAINKLEKMPNSLAPLAIAYSNIADVYKHLNQRDSTIHYLKLCYQTAIKHFDPVSKALALQNLSEEYLFKKDYPKALEYAEVAQNEYIQLKNHLEVSAVYILKSKIFQAMSNHKQAIYFADMAEKNARKFNLMMVQMKALEALSELYYLTHDYRKAADFYRKIVLLSDSIMSMENVRNIRNQLQQYELKVQTKDKEMLNKELSIIKLSNSNSELLFYIIVVLGIFLMTSLLLFYYYRRFRNRKISQIELQNKIIEKKNQELLEKSKQIEFQFEILKADNSSKEKLFSVIAHDLKNPLTIVMTSADLVYSYYDKLSKEQVLGYLQKIVDASVKMNGLLYNLLDWVMSQQGKIIPNKQKVSLDELIESAISLVQASAESKNIKLNYIASKEFTVLVDTNMIKTVLRNVLTNAVKFSNNDSEVNIKSVRIMNQENNGMDTSRIHLIIEDYGVGIESDMLNSLFSYSRYSSNTNNSTENGSGLGLIISKDFIEKNSGKIMIESKLGDGTKVVLELPEFNTKKQ